ncbi:MAG: bifunctional 2-polyprenyl-6-hydroxyphenol methylase/3-demethylubiquinol 3-O-methyltransferase UbiG [Caulobacteraceae bacterium]
MTAPASHTSIDPAEVERFSAMAAEWWDPAGKFKPLHLFNPVRLSFVRDEASRRFGRDITAPRPFEGLRLLDIGCGGGLLCEPMTRLGFSVTGVDASARNIGTARAHAEQQGLSIDYRADTARRCWPQASPPFDVVLNMEVIEHVADPERFLKDCVKLLKPGGLMIVATLNRTLKAHALAVVGAEYVLRWLPPGTHDWKKFIKPIEILGFLRGEPVSIAGPFGVSFDPISGRWQPSRDTAVNYMMTVDKSAVA